MVLSYEAALPAQVAAAKAAGVKRIFLHLGKVAGDAKAMQALLEGSGATYTVMPCSRRVVE